jgi:hypothetical protein
MSSIRLAKSPGLGESSLPYVGRAPLVLRRVGGTSHRLARWLEAYSIAVLDPPEGCERQAKASKNIDRGIVY